MSIKSSVIAVWGSPGSGKSTFSAILARYLTRDKSKAIIISPDITVPMLPVWFPNENIENSMSLGHILSSSEINNSIIAEKVKLLKSHPYIGVLGYTSGDMPLSYPEVNYERVVQTIEVVSGMVDHVIIDCTSRITDLFTPAAIEKNIIRQYLIRQKYSVSGYDTDSLTERLYEDMAGYSFLRKWIYRDGVEEININAYNDIEVILSGGRSMKIPEKFASPTQAIDVMRRMLTSCGMIIDDTMPSVLGHIDKNIRISVDKTPLVDADVGVNASIRIVNQQSVTEDKLLQSGSATRPMLDFLTACVRYGVSVCIAGATGSGKTTIMAWLLSTVPDNRRLITIEDGSREFNLVKRDADGNILNSVCYLLTRPNENPELDINQDFLLERVLRKHPNVIGVGEIRAAAECMSVAEASRTGHTCLTTIHSNSGISSYRRMMTLAKRKFQDMD